MGWYPVILHIYFLLVIELSVVVFTLFGCGNTQQIGRSGPLCQWLTQLQLPSVARGGT
jgi:uncharacterized lipoprotein NlpE involved in copper resistance